MKRNLPCLIAALLAPELGWSDDDVAAEIAAYQRLCDDEIDAARRPDASHTEAT